MKIFKFTDRRGSAVYINGDFIVCVESVDNGSSITLSHGPVRWITVTETAEEICRRLESAA